RMSVLWTRSSADARSPVRARAARIKSWLRARANSSNSASSRRFTRSPGLLLHLLDGSGRGSVSGEHTTAGGGILLSRFDRFPTLIDGRPPVGTLTVRALRVVLALVLVGTAFVQAFTLWALVSGTDPEDGSVLLCSLRVITIVGMITGQVAVVCV